MSGVSVVSTTLLAADSAVLKMVPAMTGKSVLGAGKLFFEAAPCCITLSTGGQE